MWSRTIAAVEDAILRPPTTPAAEAACALQCMRNQIPCAAGQGGSASSASPPRLRLTSLLQQNRLISAIYNEDGGKMVLPEMIAELRCRYREAETSAGVIGRRRRHQAQTGKAEGRSLLGETRQKEEAQSIP
jgi:hypothetical protein